jgi:hypothetical protein
LISKHDRNDQETASMKTSARNHFTGTVKAITKGPVSAEVTIEVARGFNDQRTVTDSRPRFGRRNAEAR